MLSNTPTHLLALFLLLTQATASQSIAGKWESVEAVDGLRELMEFSRGGRFSKTVGLSGTGTYRLDGNRALIEEAAGSDESAKSMELRIESEKLVLEEGGGEMRLSRLTRRTPDAPAFVGKWGLRVPFPLHGPDNGSLTIELTRDGQYRLRMQTKPTRGSYKVRGNRVTVKTSDGTHASSFRFEDGFLILRSAVESKREEKFKRVAW